MKKRILITNDDGIDASGIIRLARVAAKYAEVWVIAPDGQRSAASHSITLRGYIDAFPVEFPVEGVKAYAITGTPADCVRVGSLNIMPKKPDLVFSGINFGYNAGTDVQYSATVGAAMEAVFQGIPAVAFSEGINDGYKVTDVYLEDIVKEVLDTTYVPFEIVNVNFPYCKPEECKGILRDRICSAGYIYKDSYDSEEIEGGMRYRVNGQFTDIAEENSDLRALFSNYISIGKVTNIH